MHEFDQFATTILPLLARIAGESPITADRVIVSPGWNLLASGRLAERVPHISHCNTRKRRNLEHCALRKSHSVQ